MLKGDLRKKQILETAERLFTAQGYEKTGVQDILDELQLSKGSFYHHFESKDQVLQTICGVHADASAAAAGLFDETDGMNRLNRVLGALVPFSEEGLSFLLMLLPVFSLPEGKTIRLGFQEALKKSWLPIVMEALEQASAEQKVFTLYPAETASICIDLVNQMWARISDRMIEAEHDGAGLATPDLLLAEIEPYRVAMENMLVAPCGSIELISLDTLQQVTEKIHDRWKSI